MEEQKRGYLAQNFRLFHIKDKKEQAYEYHYHDFNKIIIFLSGRVTYVVEGKSYSLRPWDILLINHHDIHRPVIDPSEMYERIVIWVDASYIGRFSDEENDLAKCFSVAYEKRFNLVRLDSSLQERLRQIILGIEQTLHGKEFASAQMAEALFLQMLVYLNRIQLGETCRQGEESLKYDARMEQVLCYINSHLSEPLTVDGLAEKHYISKYYLMHRFKAETGFTVHNYILQKRLLMAQDLMRQNTAVTEAALQCGFREYTSFLRAFKKMFGMSPKEYMERG